MNWHERNFHSQGGGQIPTGISSLPTQTSVTHRQQGYSYRGVPASGLFVEAVQGLPHKYVSGAWADEEDISRWEWNIHHVKFNSRCGKLEVHSIISVSADHQKCSPRSGPDDPKIRSCCQPDDIVSYTAEISRCWLILRSRCFEEARAGDLEYI